MKKLLTKGLVHFIRGHPVYIVDDHKRELVFVEVERLFCANLSNTIIRQTFNNQ